MTDPSYPTDISEREAELGFQLVQVYATIGFCFEQSLLWIHVVAKVLSESDIIVKTTFGGDPVYIHKRYGIMECPGFNQAAEKPKWCSVSNGFQKDPQQAVFDASFDADASITKTRTINPHKAEIRFEGF